MDEQPIFSHLNTISIKPVKNLDKLETDAAISDFDNKTIAQSTGIGFLCLVCNETCIAPDMHLLIWHFEFYCQDPIHHPKYFFPYELQGQSRQIQCSNKNEPRAW